MTARLLSTHNSADSFKNSIIDPLNMILHLQSLSVKNDGILFFISHINSLIRTLKLAGALTHDLPERSQEMDNSPTLTFKRQDNKPVGRDL